MILPAIFSGNLDHDGNGVAYFSPLSAPIRLRSQIHNGVAIETLVFLERYQGENIHGSSMDMLMLTVNPSPTF